MFKKFNPKEDISNQNVLRSSVQRGIRTAIMTQYPVLAADDGLLMDAIWPKKGDGELVKWSVFISGVTTPKCLTGDLSSRDHISIYALLGEPLFFQQKNGPFFPTLRLLHKYPQLLPRVQVDRGAIRFLLAGANMMCPGFTSAGGRLPPAEEAIPAGAPVAIYCEGKEEPAAIGITKLSTEDIKKVNKDVGVELVTYLGDDLWKNNNL
ncbi:translation machinery-associated protein 20 [Tulasnella sp. UAMH 9824]|nr:translation machinery-associated protein 20 [Tulasnella sp. UAMH 9824]